MKKKNQQNFKKENNITCIVLLTFSISAVDYCGIWTVLRSLPAKYKTQHLSIIYSILGLDFDRTL